MSRVRDDLDLAVDGEGNPPGWSLWLTLRRDTIATYPAAGRIPVMCLDTRDGWVRYLIPDRWFDVLQSLRRLRRHRGPEVHDVATWIVAAIGALPITLDAWELAIDSNPILAGAEHTHPACAMIPRAVPSQRWTEP